MFKEDLNVFFDPNGIGDNANIGGKSVNGMFVCQYVELLGVEGFYPTFLCASTDVNNVPKETPVLIDGVNYTIYKFRADDPGLTLVILEEV